MSQSSDLSADPRVRWLQKEAVRVRTVDPADGDFRDLQPLKKIIGDSQIVMLGEISHFDGTTFLAKSRLVKFLHQQMNFDVLVFESGFYDMSRVWESIVSGQEPVAAVQRGLPPVWSRSPQTKDLFEYAGASTRTARPLALAGFDLQPAYISGERLLSDLDAFVARLGIASDVTTPDSEARTLAVNLFGRKYGQQGMAAPDLAARTRFYEGIEALRGRLAPAATGNNRAEANFWRQVVLSSLKSYAELVWWDREHVNARDWVSFNLRDKQNADNLLWLADHPYRGKKIIVWGASVHLIRNAAAIENNINPKNPQRPYTTIVPMGENVLRRAGKRAFTVGFTAYAGTMGIGDPADKESFHSDVRQDQDASVELEELLNAARFDYALVNFRNTGGAAAWLNAPIVSAPLGNDGMRAVWPTVMDAMFFIRVMAPNLATRPGK